MAKLIPLPPDRSPDKSTTQAGLVKTFEIELMTPMFGGGAKAKTPDADQPFRATSIRGQLQFWWRATTGASYQDVKELRAKQSEVWGSTDKASSVQVEVALNDATQIKIRSCQNKELGPRGVKYTWVDIFQKNKALPYVLFPFQGKTEKVITDPGDFIEQGAKFALKIRVEKLELWDQIETALKFWINLGGLGSRTRRGLGALYCKDLSFDNTKAFSHFLAKHGSKERTNQEWPIAGQKGLVLDGPKPPVEAWNKVVDDYRHFRQGEGFARKDRGHENTPGRSLFPEPETIRKVTGTNSPKHQRMDHIPEDAFPRAELGLPIIFSFKDQKQGEPNQTELCPVVEGKVMERMASPLILKPLVFTDKKAVPLIYRLLTPTLEEVELREGNGLLLTGQHSELRQNIRGKRLSEYQNSPLKLSPQGSAIEAFLALAKQKQYKEINP